MRQVAARVKHPCFGVRVASVHKINRLHLENVACRGEKLLFEKTVFKTFCGEKDDKYVKTPRKSAVFSVLHLSSTHFGGGGGSRTRVRKHFNRTFSGRSQDLNIPSAQGHLTDLTLQ